MEVRVFANEYAAVAALYETTPDELRLRDERQGQPLQRWFAVSEGEVVGAVTTWLRPDDRLFLYYVGRGAHGPLAEAVVGALGRSVCVTVDADEVAMVTSLRAAGFEKELEAERFRIGFDSVLSRLDRAWVPTGFSVHPADAVDEDRLFVLDNILRRDVPGTDGWHGDRTWFHEELAESPPFDRTAYLVAIDDRTGEYAGLVRIWRNPSGPRLGFIGVARPYRHTTIAAALLKGALTAASKWGHDTFTTETSLSNHVIHPRMSRLGAQSLGRFFQLVRHP